jgi:hypothetical protein
MKVLRKFSFLAIWFAWVPTMINVHASNSWVLHGRVSFIVQVTQFEGPIENAVVEVFIKGKMVSHAVTNSEGVARLEINNYMHEPTNIRVSKSAFVSKELQGVSVVHGRTYTFTLVKGEGLEIVQIENNAREASVNGERTWQAKEDIKNKEAQTQERAKQSSRTLEELQREREIEMHGLEASQKKRQEDLKSLEKQRELQTSEEEAAKIKKPAERTVEIPDAQEKKAHNKKRKAKQTSERERKDAEKP